MKVYLHPATFTIGLVSGDFIVFYFNNKYEESYFPVIAEHWELIGEL